MKVVESPHLSVQLVTFIDNCDARECACEAGQTQGAILGQRHIIDQK